MSSSDGASAVPLTRIRRVSYPVALASRSLRFDDPESEVRKTPASPFARPSDGLPKPVRSILGVEDRVRQVEAEPTKMRRLSARTAVLASAQMARTRVERSLRMPRIGCVRRRTMCLRTAASLKSPRNIAEVAGPINGQSIAYVRFSRQLACLVPLPARCPRPKTPPKPRA